MKNTILILALALAATLAAGADKFHGTQGSVVSVQGTSTLHEWKMESAKISGSIDSPAKAIVIIPVVSLKSEHAKMDKLMAEALKADKNPEIRYEMTSVTPTNPGGDAFVLKTQGRLTIAGVTRDVAFDVQGSRNPDGRYTLAGTTPIRMTQYGIKPPTAMMGTIKTGDDVTVTFRWIVEKAQ